MAAGLRLLQRGCTKGDEECAGRLKAYFQGLDKRALRHAARQTEMYHIFREDFEKLKREYLHIGPATYGAALEALAPGGNVKFMRDLWGEMLEASVAPTIYHYNAYLRACAEAADVAQAAFLLKSMRDHGVRPNARSYMSMLRLFARRGDEANAEAVLQSFLKDRHRPDERTMNARIMACGNYAAAEAQQKRFQEGWGVRPSIHTYGTLLIACIRGGEEDGDAAVRVFKRARRDNRVEVDHELWVRYIGAMKSARRHDAVSAAISGMQADGFTPDVPVYAYFLQSCRQECKYPDDEYMAAAEETLRMTSREGDLEFPLLTELYEMYADHGMVDKLEATRDHVSSTMMRGESRRMFDAVKRCHEAAGRSPEAVAALEPRVSQHNAGSNLPNYKFHGNVLKPPRHKPTQANFYRAPLRYEASGWNTKQRVDVRDIGWKEGDDMK
eukprot:TRINITY_DN13666_c0_g1_i1.p1 TRINITY_DN13666_c0_g1~~TRINITY_DN13666_c0_g1_i1.p1  ORF type:complete len:442 (+),score=168.81 TRINITY_DN13666_c0_g1_i1:126-1451(+)